MFRIIPLFVTILTACLIFPTSQDEVSRVSSSSGRVDAVLVETNGGATTSFGYLVYFVPRGQKAPHRGEVAWLYAAARNDHAFGANLKWTGPTQLTVVYRDAQEAEVRKPTVVVGSDTVVVTLLSGVTDSAAPAGGMLYNLEKGHR